ncbi:hypothetical protein Indivirus_2_56 [Indivirus ILV1]|uniref:Uncharacterized protein n=1 Tax=Indivirus ILV1 TaxID=1977633 RepID=A0A1V0SD91_9VIRU|nr:hypothetical protein Indivirus_2_56 [Indivirus ILV1]
MTRKCHNDEKSNYDRIRKRKMNVCKLNACKANVKDLHADNANVKDLHADNANVKDLHADNANVKDLHADNANVKDLNADNANVKDLNADNANVKDLNACNANVKDLNSCNANVKDLNSCNANVKDLNACNANVKDLNADNANVKDLHACNANVKDLNACNANVKDLHAENANVKDLHADNANVKDLHACNANIKDLHADNANVKDLNACNANIKDLHADNANVKDLNTCNAKVKDLTVENIYGNAVFKDIPKIVRVPTDKPTLNDALTYVFTSDDIKAFRIILETQGPHAMAARLYNNDLSYLSIEAETNTDNMGMYYGHLASAFGVLANKNEVDITKSGRGPFSIALSNSDTTITVSGTSIMGPNPVPPAGGPACIPYPNAFIGTGGISPDFSDLLAGDTIRWFSTSTNVVTELTIASVSGNTITLTTAVPTPVTRGDGFSVKPRASITLGVGPLLPELIISGVLELTGLYFPAVAPLGSFPAIIIAEGKNHTNLKQCLFETSYATGSTITYAFGPNTFMDSTNGVSQAKLVCNAGGNVLAFGQTFVGKFSGFEGFSSNVHTICFTTYIGCDRGATHRLSGSKHDFNDFIKCKIGVLAENASRPSQASWFWHCNTAIKLSLGSSFENVPPSSVGFPDLPMIIQGDPTDSTTIGVDLSYNSQLNCPILRMCDVATHGIIDGVIVTTFPDVFPPSRTLVSDTSAPNTSYGVRNSGVVYDIFTGGSCGCP